MRRTTISRATFSELAWALALALGLAACGKRGDPLPPLRRVPAAPDRVVLRQLGDRLRLEWRAPSRNQDGSTVDVDLREARILRRVIDLEALIEQQTPSPESEEAEEAEGPEESEETPAEEVDPETEVEEKPAVTAPAEADPQPAEDEPQEEAPPAPPPPPALQIPPFGAEAQVVATIPSAELGEELSYEEELDPSWVGKRVEYAVAYLNQKERRSPLPPVAQIEPVAPLDPPEAPSVEAGNGFVSIRWRSPQATNDELAFSVFRRPADVEAYPREPLNPEPIRETELEDGSVRFGTPWCYVVKSTLAPPVEEPPAAGEASDETVEAPLLEPRPVRIPVAPPMQNPAPIESEASGEACLTPEDVFPPPRPTGLVGVATPQGILLSWSEVPGSDVTGYRVYRRGSAGERFELLNEEILETPSYTDETAVAGESYQYAVTAVDDAPGINESERSEIAEVALGPPR